METIKIEKQPTVADYIRNMSAGDVLRFDISHAKAVREFVSRRICYENPDYKYPTEVNYAEGYIDVRMEQKTEVEDAI